jgi:hypothetical protein
MQTGIGRQSGGGDHSRQKAPALCITHSAGKDASLAGRVRSKTLVVRGRIVRGLGETAFSSELANL